MDYLEEDFERSMDYAVREFTGLPSVINIDQPTTAFTRGLIRENVELKRKLEQTNTDVDLADFYRLQAEVALAQTIRSSSILTFSTLGSIVLFIGLILLDAGWAIYPWAGISGMLAAYRIVSLICPLKYDNLNVMGRRLDLKKAEVEVQRTFNNACKKEEVSE